MAAKADQAPPPRVVCLGAQDLHCNPAASRCIQSVMHPLVSAQVADADRHAVAPVLADIDVVHEVIRGNREMFEVIVRRYNTQLYRVGMSYLRGHAQTEDAMQNTYIKAYRHLQRYRGRSSFATWLTRIMINECLMILRRQRRHVMESIDESEGRVEYATFAAPPETDRLSAADLKALLESAIQSLPRLHRTVYLLREVQHLSTAETAACLGLSTSNVKVCLHRARESLKVALLKSAAGVELFGYPAQYCDPLTARVMQAVRGMT